MRNGTLPQNLPQRRAAGGAGFSLLGFDLTPAVAQLKELKIARATETRSTCPYCSVSCGVLIYTIGDKAKNVTPQVIHVEGDPGSSHQSRHAVSQGSFARAGHPESAAAAEAAGAPARLRSLGRHRLDAGHRRDRAAGEEDPRRHLHRERRAGPHREPLRKHRLDRRLHRHQRVQLSRRQDHAQPGA